MKDLKRTTVIGLGLLGGSITLSVLRSFPGTKVTGYTHRASTRKKARQLLPGTEIVDDIEQSVADADLVILATPIRAFEETIRQIRYALPTGCIVTDVGSTKLWPHRWATRLLPWNVPYVGSHPIAGSEQRGVEFARDDLFDGAMCILTKNRSTHLKAVETLRQFWLQLGCFVKLMTPSKHDITFANISHLPHVVASALINANDSETLKFAGKGFIDTSRIASGPANIWADILLTNSKNTAKGIDKIIAELLKIKKAVVTGNEKQTEKLLEMARARRAELIKYKIKEKELRS